MNDPRDFQRLYSWLLKLYPARFRAVFEAEMREVFTSRLAEKRSRGRAAMLIVLLGELRDAPANLLSAYRFSSRELLDSLWQRWYALLFDPVLSLDAKTGRDSWRQAAVEISTFVGLGIVLILATYLPLGLTGNLWRSDMPVFLLAAALLPMLLVGLLRGMPRWAYPPAGWLVGYSCLAAQRSYLWPVWLAALAALLLLAILLVRMQARQQTLPRTLAHALERLKMDASQLSFGAYGLLPLVIPLVFDDGYLDSRGLWLALSAVFMILGAAGYARSRSPRTQAAALLAGTALAVLPALFDRAGVLASMGANLTIADAAWPLGFWLVLTALMLLPLLLPACQTRASTDPRGGA